jgi:Zn-dependent protease/CBS domain-containing protein
MHITFPLILIVAAIQFGWGHPDQLQGAAFGVVATLLLFACVVLHELSHSLFAMYFGSEVQEILLLPLGGVARMKEMPEQPYQELLMALAGPATSGLIGVVLIGAMILVFPGNWLSIWLKSGQAIAMTGRVEWMHLLPYLVTANLFLAGFNLIPAFPMDGGRVLRALMATVTSYTRATSIAVIVGQGLAWLIGLAGLLDRNIVLMLIALFVYIGAAQEGRMVQVKGALAGRTVRQAFSRRAQPVHPDDPLGRAVDLTLEGFQSDFPVCDGEQLIGMLTARDILVGLKEHGPGVPVQRVMRRDFPVAQPDDDLFQVNQQMSEAGLDAVPVVEGETFLGLLTQQDVQEVYRLVSVHPELLRTET